MTRENAKRWAKEIQAFADGKNIQRKVEHNPDGGWYDVGEDFDPESGIEYRTGWKTVNVQE